MSQAQRLVLKSAFDSGAVLLLLISISCSSSSAQKYAEQSGKKSYSKSYLSTKSQAAGTSYAQGGQGQGSSYAHSGGAVGGTSYAQNFQAKTSSYASSGNNGNSYASSFGYGNSYANRGQSYANSSKAVPYSQQLRFGKSSGGSLLGIMHGAPVARTHSDYSSNLRQSKTTIRRKSPAGTRTDQSVPTSSTVNSSVQKSGPKQSIYAKLH